MRSVVARNVCPVQEHPELLEVVRGHRLPALRVGRADAEPVQAAPDGALQRAARPGVLLPARCAGQVQGYWQVSGRKTADVMTF